MGSSRRLDLAPFRVASLDQEAKGTPHPGSRRLVALLCLAAFGPYMAGSVRTEQAAVYLAFVACLLLFAGTIFQRLVSVGASLVVAWSWIILVALVGAVTPLMASTLWGPGSIMGGADNFLLPLAVMLTVWGGVPPDGARSALRTVGKTVVWLSALNALIAIASSFYPLDDYLRRFWSAAGVDVTVADNAQTLGRYGGVFGQPAEAGLVYSIAGLLTVYLYRRSPLKLYCAVGLIGIGGALSVSKVFLLVGAPIMLWYLWRSYHFVGRVAMAVGMGAVSAAVWATGFLQQWSGFDYLARLVEVPQGQSAVEFYTAGRWNQGSPMSVVLGTVLDYSPLSGFGLRGLVVPYDSAWTEMMVIAGIFGTIALVYIFLAIFRLSLQIREPHTRRFAWLFSIVLLGASAGIPSLTANRASTIVWVIVGLLTLIPLAERDDRASKVHIENQAPPAGEPSHFGNPSPESDIALRPRGFSVDAGWQE